ncbi:MAG: DNA polymerase/3'-5' exonuclease PolX [Ignavibacteria bacterium]|nr:DNA polymerase/3'-5' exonuclease PolX [Ignavibacteria bacterium]
MEALVSVLFDIATLLEMLDENPFKIRAIQSAARALEDADLTALGLEEILALPGVGKGTGELIAEFHETGSIRQYHELLQRIPESVLEVTRLRGLGAKKVRVLWQELGILSIADLHAACESGRVAAQKGFGAKTQTNILEAIAQYRTAESRFHLHRATREAERLCKQIRPLAGVQGVEICGGLRCGEETVSHIELWLCCLPEDVPRLQTEIANLPEISHITTHNAVSMQFSTPSGIPTTIEFSPRSAFSLRFHALSSDEHFHAALLQYCLSKNVATLSAESEEDLYRQVGLPYIPPELRSNPDVLLRSDIHAAVTNLVDISHLRGTLHVHTTWSDGKHSVRQMAERARALGYEYIAICDHSKTAVYANGLTEERVKRQHEEIDALNAENVGIHILKGIESDILSDGALDYSDAVLETFDMVVASVHTAFTMTPEAMTARLMRALQHPATTILGHPTGRLLLKRKGYTFDINAILETALKHKKIIEINANPHRLDFSAENAAKAHRMGITLSINTDAHNCDDLELMRYGVLVARRAGIRSDAILNSLGWEEFRERIQQSRS